MNEKMLERLERSRSEVVSWFYFALYYFEGFLFGEDTAGMRADMKELRVSRIGKFPNNQ